MSTMIEDFGDQTFLQPLRGLLGDAREVMEENLRRIEAAQQALAGDYPGAGAARHLNGQQQALPPAPAPNHPPKPSGLNGTASVQEWVAAALSVADEVDLIGTYGRPGVLQSADVVDLLGSWGWRKNLYSNATQTVSSALSYLMKIGTAERIDRGAYRWKSEVAPTPVAEPAPPASPAKKVLAPARQWTSPAKNEVKTADMILSVMRGLQGRQVRAIDILEKMVKAGWTTNSKDPLAVVNTTLSQLVRSHPNVSRPQTAQYLYL